MGSFIFNLMYFRLKQNLTQAEECFVLMSIKIHVLDMKFFCVFDVLVTKKLDSPRSDCSGFSFLQIRCQFLTNLESRA